jgi:hypothetical protein
MTIKERVENLLKASVKARNSDIELLILYMQKSGMELSEKQIEIFRKMPSAETITRIRRKLQEEGKYEASDAVNQARYDKMKEYQESFNKLAGDPIAQLAKLGYKIVED